MIESSVLCPYCGKKIDYHYHTYWMCGSCGTKYPCVQGIPKLYIEERLKQKDKYRRDFLYDSFIGKIYSFWNAFLLLPVRPIRISVIYWIAYFLFVALLSFLAYHCVNWVVVRQFHETNILDMVLLIMFLSSALFLAKYRFFLSLLLLAIPVRLIISWRRFKPSASHPSVHAEFQKEYIESENKLRILDVATGSCSSLFRHGWVKLNAELTAVDLSERMITQGMRFMSSKGVPVDFIMCDAAGLPFEDGTFDIVTSYGAVNGYGAPEKALHEMVRVTKPEGKILFLDEQAYESASWLELLYYKHVLIWNNNIDGCPTKLLPVELEDIQVHQVYEFVYICTARKKEGL